MTQKEAIEQMRNGVKITHSYFSKEEWMTIQHGKILTEEGYTHNYLEFWGYRNSDGWMDGYSIFKP